MALQTRNVLKRLFSYIFEEKTHLSSLLERVAKGEEIMIIRHGKPLAWLTRIDFAIAKLKAVRKNCTLDGIS